MAIPGLGALSGAAKNILGSAFGKSPGAFGHTVALEGLKYGAIIPAFYATGLADPNRGKRLPAGAYPPGAAPLPMSPALTLRDQIMYGSPEKAGLFGSTNPLLGGSERSPGLIEKRFNEDNIYRNKALEAGLESQRISVGGDLARQQAVSTAQTILGREQAERDKYSAQQTTFSNMGANTANIFAGVGGTAIAATYGGSLVNANNIVPASGAIASRGVNYASTRAGAFGARTPRGGYGSVGAMGMM